MPDQNTELPLSTELAGWLEAWRRAKEKAAHWEEAAQAAQRHITDALDAAGATVGTVNGQAVVRWREVVQSRVDGERLRADHPELAEQYSRPITYHRLTIPNRPSHKGVSL